MRTDDSGLTFITKAVILLVVFAIVSAVYINFIAYKTPAPAGAVKIAELKDTVKISYVGYFENGLVFDTSIKAVGEDNSTWPKALSFATRATYNDFAFVLGKTDCTQGQQDCAITGMTQATLGLSEGSQVTATITPEKGYGPKDPKLLSVRQIHEQVPVRATMNSSVFTAVYKSTPQEGLPVRDPVWGWTVLVHLSGGMVTIENSPDLAATYQLHVNNTKGGKWYATVQGIDDAANNGTGAISIMNAFTFTGGNKLQVKDTSGDIFVTDNEDGTFTVDKNKEFVGVNLVFRITVLSITKAS